MESDGKKLLILDLDETLIFATSSPLPHPSDFIVGEYHVYRRPFLNDFLTGCFVHFNVAVWTSATRDYAHEVVNNIFPSGHAPVFVWSRERCTRRFNHETREEEFIKNLSKLRRKGYKLDHVIVVDDTPANHRNNYGNLVRTRPFSGDPNDRELFLLSLYLPTLKDLPSVRKVDKSGWRETARKTASIE